MDRDVTCRSLRYHYTSLAGLNGIVTSGSIHATYADFLNDAQEIWHGPRTVHRVSAAELGYP